MQRHSVTLSLSDDEREFWEAIALRNGCVWGQKPSLSVLLQRAAAGMQVRGLADDFDASEVRVLLGEVLEKLEGF